MDLNIIVDVIVVIGFPLFALHIQKRVSGYAGELGKLLAISKKIDEVVDQQKKITRATEETKSEIEHLAWNKKEAITIRRNKLEEYLELVFSTIDSIKDYAIKIGSEEADKFRDFPITIIPKLTTLQMLYLSELEQSNKKLTDLIGQFESIVGNYLAGNIDRDKYEKQSIDNISKLGGTTREISEESKKIINSMLNVECT